jgi:hypothetical protein
MVALARTVQLGDQNDDSDNDQTKAPNDDQIEAPNDD